MTVNPFPKEFGGNLNELVEVVVGVADVVKTGSISSL